jgi:hypothetical protein
MRDPRAYEQGSPVLGGIAAGVIGGSMMAAVLTGANAARGMDVWIVLKAAATPFLGERAQVPGFDAGAVGLGMLCHFAIAVLWSVLFSAVSYGLSRSSTVIAGALWGVVVWFGMYYLVLPVAGLPELAHRIPLANAISAHLVFGTCVGIGFLPFQNERPTLDRTPLGAT